MKNFNLKIVASSFILLTVFACKKGEMAETTADAKVSSTADYAAEAVTDSVSSAASMEVKDKKFVKTADVDMEVKDVYEATIFIEKQLKDLLYKKYLKKRTDIAKFQLNQQFILDQSKDDIKLSLTGIVQEMIKRINDDETK